jgi:hypothetical protein
MARRSADDPSSWYGTRTVSYMAQCGFCAAPTTLGDTALPEGQHACLHELPYFDKLWICSCECNSEWKPYAVVVEKDGSIGAAPENLVVAEYMTQKAKKKQAKEAAAEAKANEAAAEETEAEQDA